jgi:hypothetical protein
MSERINIWDDNMDEKHPAIEYKELHTVISLEGLRYDLGFATQEVELLQPRLEKLGYSHIKWGMGEYDSFGPLTRTCMARNQNGEVVWFFYG